MNLSNLEINGNVQFNCDTISLVCQYCGIRIFQGVLCKVGLALTLIGALFPALRKSDIGSSFECSCLLIDCQASLWALRLDFEKANNMKPIYLFIF